MNAIHAETEIISANCPKCSKPVEMEIPTHDSALGDIGRRFILSCSKRIHCDECAAIVDAEREEQQRNERIARLESEWREICPTRYYNLKRELLPTKANALYDRVMAWPLADRGMIFRGNTGSGKTFLMTAVGRRLYIETGGRVQFFDCVAFAHECGKRFAEFRGDQWLDDLSRKKVLIFDDLGKFKMTDRIEAELFGLIERRMAWGRPTLFTTNDTSETLSARMSPDRGEPFVRRLREYCDTFTL